MSNNESLFLLTVRGTLVPKNLEAARVLHNETAGSAPGIAAARALGDLSHKVYAPAMGDAAGELFFIDFWQSPEGIGKFFSDHNVQEQAGKMFSKRDATIWMPARGSHSFDLPASAQKNDRYVGVVRGSVKSPEEAIAVFKGILGPKINDARRRGQLSHNLYVKVPMPGDNSGHEILGVDVWCDPQGMQEHYGDLKGYEKAFAAAPQTSVWQAAPGNWSEW